MEQEGSVKEIIKSFGFGLSVLVVGLGIVALLAISGVIVHVVLLIICVLVTFLLWVLGDALRTSIGLK